MAEPIPPEILARMMLLHEVSVPLTVGRATVAWNTLSGAIYAHFKLLSELDDQTAKALFFTITSDRSQRDMVGQLIDKKLKPEYPALAKKGRSLLGRADGLAGKRNDILHVVYVDELTPHKVSQLQERGHLKGKTGASLIDAIHEFTIACLDLSLAVTKLRGEILATPKYQNLKLAEAVRAYSAQRKPEEWANQGGFGLLDFPATIPPMHEEGQG